MSWQCCAGDILNMSPVAGRCKGRCFHSITMEKTADRFGAGAVGHSLRV